MKDVDDGRPRRPAPSALVSCLVPAIFQLINTNEAFLTTGFNFCGAQFDAVLSPTAVGNDRK